MTLDELMNSIEGNLLYGSSRFRGTVIALCNKTMKFVQPWVDGGYRVIMVDPQHETTSFDGVAVYRIAATVLEAMPFLRRALTQTDVAFVAAFPPCTDMAVSGARWFEHKRKLDKMFQAKAVAVAEQCRTFIRLSGAPGFCENPVSVLSGVFGKAQHSFHPHYYTAHCPEDNYTKLTQLWTEGDFVMPPIFKDHSLGKPDDRIHKAPPGADRANFRSATPRGFSKALYLANAPHLRELSR
jgi:hypothetical protein